MKRFIFMANTNGWARPSGINYLSTLCIPLLIFLTSCAAWHPEDKIRDLYWSAKKKMRSPGEELIGQPDVVWEKYTCTDNKLPFIQVEKNELLPPRVRQGEEFNHRFVYAMCSPKLSDIVSGSLIRSIYHGNRVIFQDISKNYKIKPGRWRTDAFISVPAEAEPGVYSLELKFDNGKNYFRETHAFIIFE